MKEYSKEERESIFSKILDIDEIKDSLKPEGKRELYFIIDNKELENSRDQAIKDIKKAIEENEEMIEVNLRYLDEVKKRYENSDNEVERENMESEINKTNSEINYMKTFPPKRIAEDTIVEIYNSNRTEDVKIKIKQDIIVEACNSRRTEDVKIEVKIGNDYETFPFTDFTRIESIQRRLHVMS